MSEEVSASNGQRMLTDLLARGAVEVDSADKYSGDLSGLGCGVAPLLGLTGKRVPEAGHHCLGSDANAIDD